MAEYEGVTQESPAGSDPNGASSAGTLNTGQPAPPQTQPTVPYPRFQEANHGWRAAEARAAAAEQAASLREEQLQSTQQRLQALEQQLQQRAARPSRSPEEEHGRRAAFNALKELQSDDPEHQRLMGLSRAAPALAQAVIEARQQIAELRQAQAQSFTRTEESRLYHMATQAGMPISNKAEFDALNNYVAGIIRTNPEALQRFLAGDTQIMPAALQIARQHYDAHARTARAGLAQTKAQTQRLPPRIGGGTPGSPPPPRYDSNNPKGSMAAIHAAAEAALQSQLG